MEIIKADEMITEGLYHPNWMIMGSPGSGKTTALRTFPEDWRVLVLNLFGNKESLEGASNVDIVDYSDYDARNANAFMKIEEDRKEIISMLNKGTFPYSVIAIDTVTGLLRYMEYFILLTNPDGRGIGGAPAQHHYRGLSHMCGEFITSFLGYPISTVLIAHTEIAKNEQTGSLQHAAIMSGARWRHTIYAYVGEVYRAFGQPSDVTDTMTGEPKTEFLWQTQPDSEWPMLKSTMNRDMGIWGKYVIPDFSKLLERRGVVK